MKKAFLIIVLTIIFNGFFNLAIAQSAAESNSSSSIMQIKSTSAIFQNISNILQESFKRAIGAKGGEVIEKTISWFPQRKEAIETGWQEEKQEFKGGLKQILSDIWQKIKSLVIK